MEIKTYKINNISILPESLSEIFTKDEYCVVDIETTGLSSKYNKVILIGILYNKDKNIVLKQFFAENEKEEKDILNEFADTLKNFLYVITYNGATFDLPFLKKRFHYNNLKFTFDDIKHIDILQYIRKEKKQLPMDNLKLKTVEKFLGINRKDTISGKDSVLLYKEFVKNPSPSLKKTILLHNYEDIYYLNKLLIIFDHININKYDLVGKSLKIDYNSRKIDFNFYPSKICTKKGLFTISGFTKSLKDTLDFIYYGSTLNFEWYPKDSKFQIEISSYEGYLSTGEKCIYINLKDLNLSKSLFEKSKYYDEKYFPNDFLILKIDNKFNIDLIGDLLYNILDLILNNKI